MCYSSSLTGEPLFLVFEAVLCLSDCLVVLLYACLAAGVRPEGNHLSWEGAQAATIAVKGANKITGVKIDKITERRRMALRMDVEKNGPSLLGSRIIAPWYVASIACPVQAVMEISNEINIE